MNTATAAPVSPSDSATDRLVLANRLTVADAFCGIGGFHVAASRLGLTVVWACDIDEHVQRAYEHNFGLRPSGDICSVNPEDVPDHDVLCAGFPCQPFSIIGARRALQDPRGGLFFDLVRLIRAKAPRAVVLENVKQLSTIQSGTVISRIVRDLHSLGYTVSWRILNALDFGLPQRRERTIIVGIKSDVDFVWPTGNATMRPLSTILEDDPDKKYFASPMIRRKRRRAHTAAVHPSIWHENKGGNISSHPYSCALRAGASYNYLLVNGERRLTLREQLRLQGFPETWTVVCNDAQTKKQIGNAVPVPMVQAVLANVLECLNA